MMSDRVLLSWLREGYSARLDTDKTAKLLGFGTHDLAPLVGAGLLKPLGNPTPNAPKYFALVEVLALAADRDWLNRATKTLAKHWQAKNREQRNKRANGNAPPGGEGMCTHAEANDVSVADGTSTNV